MRKFEAIRVKRRCANFCCRESKARALVIASNLKSDHCAFLIRKKKCARSFSLGAYSGINYAKDSVMWKDVQSRNIENKDKKCEGRRIPKV